MSHTRFSTISVISLHAVVRPCSMVTATSPISGKEYLQ
jgi:hypothetical protein